MGSTFNSGTEAGRVTIVIAWWIFALSIISAWVITTVVFPWTLPWLWAPFIVGSAALVTFGNMSAYYIRRGSLKGWGA